MSNERIVVNGINWIDQLDWREFFSQGVQIGGPDDNLRAVFPAETELTEDTGTMQTYLLSSGLVVVVEQQNAGLKAMYIPVS